MPDVPSSPALATKRFMLLEVSTPLVAVLLVIQIVLGLILTWGTWADVLIDFGRELYVAEQLSEGAVLYRDIAYFNGPVSPYFNALCFYFWGASFRTLVIVNAIVLWLFTFILFDLLRTIFRPLTSLISASSVLLLVAFNQCIEVGNYNWIAPYSHEMIHGLCLSIAAIWFANRFLATENISSGLLCGGLCGLVFLTKCEIAIALYGAIAAMFVANLLSGKNRFKLLKHSTAIVATGFVLAIGLCGLFLLRFLPFESVVDSLLGSWKQLLKNDLTSSPYYSAVMGTADIGNSLNLIYGWVVLYGSVLGISAFVARSETDLKWNTNQIAAALFVCMLTIFFTSYNHISWLEMGRPWPFVLLYLLVREVIQVLKFNSQSLTEFSSSGDGNTPALTISMLVWSGLLLLKIALYARIFHYGFALATPTIAMLIAVSWEWWPKWVESRGGQQSIARAGLFSLLCMGAIAHFAASAEFLSKKQLVVEARGDRILADDRGAIINELLDEIEKRVAKDETILCLPEGIILNYLTKRRTSTRHINFVPGDVIMFGEQKMLQDLELHPPDWIIMINRDTSEYGVNSFTIDYAQETGKWIQENYEITLQVGGEFMTREAGYRFLRKVERQPAYTH